MNRKKARYVCCTQFSVLWFRKKGHMVLYEIEVYNEMPEMKTKYEKILTFF